MPIRKPDEDLFEESRMSFGEHLEELRKVLVKALIGISIGCVIGFYFADRIVDFLTVPLDRALTKFNQGGRGQGYRGQSWILGAGIETLA